MSNNELEDNKKNFITFKVDKRFRMFVGEIKGDIVEKISPGEVEGFKDGDKVVVMHSEDWLWVFNELTDSTSRKQ
jgi:hypothetical protein